MNMRGCAHFQSLNKGIKLKALEECRLRLEKEGDEVKPSACVVVLNSNRPLANASLCGVARVRFWCSAVYRGPCFCTLCSHQTPPATLTVLPNFQQPQFSHSSPKVTSLYETLKLQTKFWITPNCNANNRYSFHTNISQNYYWRIIPSNTSVHIIVN